LSAATISIVSRHTYLAAVPAALLTASALRELGRRLAERRTRAPSALLSLAPLVLGATALLSGAWLDLRRGVEAGLQATAITRRAAVEIRNALDTHPGSATLTLVDLPYQVPGATDITAYAFANGTAEMVKIVSGRSDVTVQLRRSHAGQVNSANRSTRLAVDELSALASDPSRIVLVFDPLTGNPLASGPGLQVAPGGRPRTSQRR
jgi:hypothetical protein